ncbi:hypothetical protein [Clostridium sp.]|jgi:hypothetical protein|uniref:hypothetical protein n=1 Tax=Clostridium sp. TaxID=1506 RepID=UPI0025C5F58B|nr:hypothetical protein [Clostridium sp.]MCI9069242.1 hypothetical protein [Clostridium sp.]MCI9304659.1 hypothetical protein [Clostridium sp.]
MSEKKLYTHRRWHEPPKATSIGRVEISEEEQKENRKILRRFMREDGVLKEDDKEEE